MQLCAWLLPRRLPGSVMWAHVAPLPEWEGGRRGGGDEGSANYEINLDTKPGRHCGLKLQKPRHCVESCVLHPESRVPSPCMLSDPKICILAQNAFV